MRRRGRLEERAAPARPRRRSRGVAARPTGRWRTVSVAAPPSASRRPRRGDRSVDEHGAVHRASVASAADVVGRVPACGRRATAAALSYSGRNRTGAGVSGSGSGASGTSNSSRPALVAERAQRRAHAARGPRGSRSAATTSRGRPAGPGRTRRGSGARRRRSTAPRSSGRPSQRLGRRHVDLAAAAPHAARRHLDERRAGCGRRRPATAASRSGKLGAERGRAAGPSSAARSASIAAAASAITGSRSTSRRCGAWSRWRRSSASSTGWVERPQRQASSAVSEVDRRPHHDDAHGPRARRVRGRARRGRTRSSRDHSARYGSSGTWACRPTRWCDGVERVERRARSRSSWRAIVARFRARRLRTSGTPPILACRRRVRS